MNTAAKSSRKRPTGKDVAPARRGSKQSFAARFMELKGDRSFKTLAEEMYEAGFRITPAALHKWATGGGIDAENLLAIAQFFAVSPSRLFFGIEDESAVGQLSEAAQQIGRIYDSLPERHQVPLRTEVLTLGDLHRPKQMSDADAAFYRRLEADLRQLKSRR